MKEKFVMITDKIIDLWKSSAIIQGTLALAFAITVCVMYIQQKPVPVELLGFLSLIIGYYFGTKTQQRNNLKG